MLQLIDGPCKGIFLVKRAPDFLRAVIDKKGEKDVLDQIEDTPKRTEKVYVYQRDGGFSTVHIKMVKRSESGWYVMAEYLYLPDVDGETLRDNPTWQNWATERKKQTRVFCSIDEKVCDRVIKACCSCPRDKAIGDKN